MAPRRILFSRDPGRNETLAKQIDPDRFAIAFDSLTERGDLAEFEFLVALTIPDLQWLATREAGRVVPGHLVPPLTALELAHDKLEFNRFLRRAFPDCVPDFEQDFALPYLIKKRRDAGANHTWLIRTAEEEQQHRAELESTDFFRQVYVPGRIEYTAHIFFHERILAGFTVEFHMNRDWYVRGIRMQPFQNVEMVATDLQHAELFAEILNELCFRGFCCFNYKLIDGQPKIFELNPRLGGSAHLRINEMLEAMVDHLDGVRSIAPLKTPSS